MEDGASGAEDDDANAIPLGFTIRALYWQTQGKRTLKRVNALMRDAMCSPFAGLGKPEPLKWELQGAWSRRIDSANRLVYMVEDNDLCILSVRDHY